MTLPTAAPSGEVLAAVDPSKVITGPLGMLVFLLLVLATWLLVRSFRHQMRKLDQAGLPHEDPRPHGPRHPVIPIDDSGPKPQVGTPRLVRGTAPAPGAQPEPRDGEGR